MRLAATVALVCLCACGQDRAAPAPAAIAPAAAPAAPDAAMKAFCLRNFERIRHCFSDDAYWDTFVTFYFASLGVPVDSGAKRRMIGNLKDDIAKLDRGHSFAQNCDAMLATRRLPTAAQMARVRATDGKSCAAFGAELGLVTFSEGVFHLPR
jgi:hypothetical protein